MGEALKLKDVMKKQEFRSAMKKVVSEEKYQHFIRKMQKKKTDKEISDTMQEMKETRLKKKELLKKEVDEFKLEEK